MFDKPAAIRPSCRLAACLVPLAWLAGACLASLAAGAAHAQAPPRHYQVEVVIFAQPAGGSVELPPRQAPDAATAPEMLQDAPGDPPLLPEGFQPPREPLVLTPVAARLDRGGYRLLWHQGWVQPPASRQGVDVALLAALGQGRADPGLAGRIGLTEARFLHLGMQLEARSGDLLEAEMTQRRRIRPGVEHYFDHPRIGVIAVVTEVESETSQEVSAP